MPAHKLPRRVSIKKTEALFAKSDRANQSNIPSPQAHQESYAGWSWEDGADPHLQTER